MPPVPDAAFSKRCKRGEVRTNSEERLDASVRRILQAKARLGLTPAGSWT